MSDPASIASGVASIWNGWNIGKIFKSCLDMKVYFQNNSDEELTFIGAVLTNCEVKHADPLTVVKLKPKKSCMIEVVK